MARVTRGAFQKVNRLYEKIHVSVPVQRMFMLHIAIFTWYNHSKGCDIQDRQADTVRFCAEAMVNMKELDKPVKVTLEG